MTWLPCFPDPPAPCPAGSSGTKVEIEVETRGDTAVMVVTGDLDLMTRPVRAERLSAVLGTRPRQLVLDLGGAGFMDCGSARLVASASTFLPAGGRLVIRRPSPVARRVLELTGYDAACDIED